MRPLVLAMLLLAATGGSARAGVFGGFSADESKFLRGTDSICTPIPAEPQTSKTSTCRKAAPDEVARTGFRRGTVESGAGARFTAAASGTTMTLTDPRTGAVLVRWTSIDPISEVVAVQTSPNAKLVAVEMRIRFGGRLADEVMVFHFAGAPAKVEPAAPAGPVAPPAAAGPRSKAMEAALKVAWKASRAKAHAKAEKAFRDALSMNAAEPEARYGLALSLAGQKKLPAAVAELQALAGIASPETIIWQVEARMEPGFKPLLADPAFRKAVGLDGAAAKSTYERLVGHGGKWEQPGTPCDTVRVNLTLNRRPRAFDLLTRSTCQGSVDSFKLDGTWTVDAAGQLVLTFPNPGAADEVVPCTLSTCPDGSGEDCMLCGAGTDFEMRLRTVQR